MHSQARRTLIHEAHIVTMAGLADEQAAPRDILIEDSRIAAIGSKLQADDAEIVDGRGRIVIPGLVNAHLHTWQSAMRGVAYDWNLLEYLAHMHFRVAPLYEPEDIYHGTLAGALNQIACGTTTLADWCHNAPTTAHSDAAVRALRQSGVRAVFLPAAPKPSEAVQNPADVVFPRAELERLLAGPFSDRNGLLTLGMAVSGPHYSSPEAALADLRQAKALGLVISMHHSGGPPRSPDGWARALSEDLLGPHVNIVHGNHIEDALLADLVRAGASFTVTPEVEMNDGHGHPITGRLRDLGAMPSLGVDIESAISGEMLQVARFALAHQRLLDHEARRLGHANPAVLTAYDALSWATIGGARALGLEHKIGTLEVGKQADLVVIDARAFNLWPVHAPVSTVMQASLANIEGVMIAGAWRKRGVRLPGQNMSALRDDLTRSAQRIAGLAALPSALASPA